MHTIPRSILATTAILAAVTLAGCTTATPRATITPTPRASSTAKATPTPDAIAEDAPVTTSGYDAESVWSKCRDLAFESSDPTVAPFDASDVHPNEIDGTGVSVNVYFTSLGAQAIWECEFDGPTASPKLTSAHYAESL